MSFSPENWFEIRLYQVTPRPTPKYFGFGPECTDRTGTMNRIPSADATSPPPHTLASVERACAATSRSEEHTSELQSLMRISYAVFCLKKKKTKKQHQQC